jgi:hypothetical protein
MRVAKSRRRERVLTEMQKPRFNIPDNGYKSTVHPESG